MTPSENTSEHDMRWGVVPASTTTVASYHLGGEHFNLHPDVCVPQRVSLGSYLTSVLPENILRCGKGKHGSRESYCTFVCSVIIPGP